MSKAISKHKTKLAPEILCRILSPFSAKELVEKQLDLLLEDEELFDLAIELANRSFLVPTLYKQICIHDLSQKLDQGAKSFFVEMTRFMADRNRELSDHVKWVVGICNENDINPLLMKGAATLFSDVYPDRGVRFMSDLDILFKEDEALEAFHLLKRHGCFVPDKYLANNKPTYLTMSEGVELPRSQHLLPLYREKAPCAIEVHHRPISSFLESFMSNGEAFLEAIPIELSDEGELEAYKMSPVHEVIHCFIHSELAHKNYLYGIFDLRQMDYFVRLVKQYEDTFDWAEVFEVTEQAGYEKELYLYLKTINKLFGVDLFVPSITLDKSAVSSHYNKGIRSCFPKHNLTWRVRLMIKEFASVLSLQSLSSRFTIDNKRTLYKARLLYSLRLAAKYIYPPALLKRLKFALRML